MKMMGKIFFKTWHFPAAILLAVCLCSPPAQAAPPENDDIDHARKISAGGESLTIDLSEATVDPMEPTCAGDVFQSVWFAYTATKTQRVSLEIVAVADTAEPLPNISIWTFGNSQLLESVECYAEVQKSGFTATVGQTYYIQVYSPVAEGLQELYLHLIPGVRGIFHDGTEPIASDCKKQQVLKNSSKLIIGPGFILPPPPDDGLKQPDIIPDMEKAR